MARPTCGTCRFYSVAKDDLKRGTCCEMPPQAHPLPTRTGQVMTVSTRPDVFSTDPGCCKHQARGAGEELPVLGAATPIGNGGAQQ